MVAEHEGHSWFTFDLKHNTKGIICQAKLFGKGKAKVPVSATKLSSVSSVRYRPDQCLPYSLPIPEGIVVVELEVPPCVLDPTHGGDR